MDDDRSSWHLGDEAIYDYLERSLSDQAMVEAHRHQEACLECARRLRDARLLFDQIADLAAPPLDTDLAPKVVASLKAARSSAVRWRWVLAGQAATATIALAALGIHLERWIGQATRDPAFRAIRQAGAQLLVDVSGWLAPFLDFVPSSALRLAPLRLSLPHLQAPPSAWAALVGTALLLGVLGNTLLLRSPRGAVPTVTDHGNGTATRGERVPRAAESDQT
jgi:hypothetical protein